MHPDQLHQLATIGHREAISAAEQYRTRRAARRRARRDTQRPTRWGTRDSPRALPRLRPLVAAFNLTKGAWFAGLRSPRNSQTLRGRTRASSHDGLRAR